jgi:adenylate cyclase
MSNTARRLAAILAADVAGYSRLMGAAEEGTLERLKALRRELLDPKIAEHHGRIVKTTGDGMLVEFASIVDAVRHRGLIQYASDAELGEVPHTRTPIRIGEALQVRTVAPKLGQHNAEIFGRLGVTEAEIEDLRARGLL